MLVDFSEAPRDPLRRLLWLSGVKEKVTAEMDEAWAGAYYDARLQRQLDAALSMDLHSRKRVMAYTRAENERRGRTVRWGDGLDG
jgi:hypothetical protein